MLCQLFWTPLPFMRDQTPASPVAVTPFRISLKDDFHARSNLDFIHNNACEHHASCGDQERTKGDVVIKSLNVISKLESNLTEF